MRNAQRISSLPDRSADKLTSVSFEHKEELSMPKGYCGRILHIDLSSQSIEIERPDEAFYRTYVGGSCLAAYYVFKGMSAGVDALDPENVLVFAASPTTGAPVSGASRFNVTAKSPLTGTMGDSQAGGFWGPELKAAGFDAVVIRGAAARPVYLWIHDGECEVRDASHLWGTFTKQAQQAIRDELGDQRVRVALIGPGGESLVRYACIANELRHFNGRTGMGAVMGSKNLKAVAVRGTHPVQFHDREGILAMAKAGAQSLRANSGMRGLQEFGTALVVESNQAVGGLPTRNWQSGVLPGAEGIGGIALSDTVGTARESCWACAVRCKRVLSSETPRKIDPEYGGPEYESICALGPYLGIDDLETICKANELCNKYTLDTISVGGTIAFAMECFEKGIIGPELTHGLNLVFGDSDAALKLIEMIGRREGIGDILAEGCARASRHFGHGASELAVHVKGMELPAHMPQVKASLAIVYACCPFGPDHQSSEHDPSIRSEPFSETLTGLGFRKPISSEILCFEKAKLAAYTQRAFGFLDTLDLCQFCFGSWTLYPLEDAVLLLNLATGWGTNLWELMQLGERRTNLMRAFNAREGFTRHHDRLPQRMFEPLDGGPTAGWRIDQAELDKAQEQYYELLGWDPATGNPTRTKLSELGLEWVLDLQSP